MKWIQTLLMVAMIGFGATAYAQWQWIDKDGHKVFSDRAPPVDIPDKNILKRPPGRGPAVVTLTDTTKDAESPAIPPVAGKSSGSDKELEAKKKQAVQAEAAKRKAAEAQFAKAKMENCTRAKQSKATMESGARLVHTTAAGEREIMDETALADEVKRLQTIIDRDCK